MSTMRAVVLHAVGELKYEQVAVPSLRPGTVRVRVGFCGVCGSDIPRCFEKGTYHFPTICGHEFAGTVESVAADVTDFRAGDRVAVFPLLWCGRCSACEAGRYAQCMDYGYLGSRSDGGFAEFVVAPARNLLRVPGNVSLEVASMTEPAAVALHALRRANREVFGSTLAIFGAGPIGILVAQWARAMGARSVLLFDILPAKLELARRMGFSGVFDSRSADPVKVINEQTAGEGAHIAIEAAGVPATLNAAISVTRRGGATVMLGNPSGDAAIPAKLISQAMRREIDLAGTWNSDYSPTGNHDDWHAVMNAFASGQVDPAALITHNVGLGEAIPALQMMHARKEFFAKVLVHP